MESLQGRCRVVTSVFVAIVVVSALAILSDLSLVYYLDEISSGGLVDESTAERIDARQALVGVVQVALFVACAVAFLTWFHRAHKNLSAGGLEDLQYSPGWAVGGFFVPILNLVRPYQVMKEVWTGSARLSDDLEAGARPAASPPPHVGWWWGTLLVSSFLGNASGRLMLGAQDVDQLLVAGWMTVASDLMDIPAALLALFLIRGITDLQERARARPPTTEVATGA